MRSFSKTNVACAVVAALALSSIAIAQPKLPNQGPTAPTGSIAAKIVSVGGNLTCGTQGARISVVIATGAIGSKGTAKVTRGSSSWSANFDIPPNKQQTVEVPTSSGNCMQLGYFNLEVNAPNLKASKLIEPATVTFRESAGPI